MLLLMLGHLGLLGRNLGLGGHLGLLDLGLLLGYRLQSKQKSAP